MALKYMAGAMPSTPHTALYYLTGTPHITDYLKGEAEKGAVRLMGQGDWTLDTAPSGKGIIKAHSTLSNNFLHTLNFNKHDSCDITKPKLVLDHSYTITYPTASLTEDYKNRLNSDIIEASTHGICCFTDGFKTEHGTGGGFVISDTRTETITEHNSFKMKDTLGTYYESINNIMDNNNIDLIINFALKTKRLLKKEEKDDTGVT